MCIFSMWWFILVRVRCDKVRNVCTVRLHSHQIHFCDENAIFPTHCCRSPCHTAGANHVSRQSDTATNNAVNNKMGPVMLINITQSSLLAFAAAPDLASKRWLFELSCLAPSFTVIKGRNFLCRTNKYFLF